MQGDAHPTKVAVRNRRDRTIAQLTESFARDELSLEAFETRIDAAYCCKTDAEFDALIADLRHEGSFEAAIVVVDAEPARAGRSAGVSPTSLARVESRPVVRALFSNIERCDQAAMPRATKIEAIFGNIELDLRETTFAAGVTEIGVNAIFSSVEIVVPADITVEVHGGGVFGNFEGATRATADPDAPTLRIVGSAIFASVVVKTLPPLRVQRLAEQLRTRRLLPP
jgi:Cell wall-active antibiotics response 4TMS YvqF/Domain of unknown function (DUF1707)